MLRWHQTPYSEDGGKLAGCKLLQLAVAQAQDATAARGEVEIVGYEDAGELMLAVQLLDQRKDGFGGFAV
jgi:hypothetical protein